MHAGPSIVNEVMHAVAIISYFVLRTTAGISNDYLLALISSLFMLLILLI